MNGERVAIPVNSPVVYASRNEENPGEVFGGCADDLATQIIETISNTYKDSKDFSLKSAWVGTCCDGQYQALNFKSILHAQLGIPMDETFSEVVWDPSHWLNLSILDVRDGKRGSSESYLKRIINRAKNVHTMFQRGKMLSTAITISRAKNLKLKMTKGSCSTRFWTSQYDEFMTIIQCYPVYLEAFRKFGFSELKEYEIAGIDFVTDLCAVVDVMKPVIDLMVKVQSLHCPCWKICSWFPEVERILQTFTSSDILQPSIHMKTLKENIGGILEREMFKGQKLVCGWLIVEKTKTKDQWEARDLTDCDEDLKQFAVDMLDSLQARYTNCVEEMCHHLTALDIERIFGFLCGTRKKGKPTISEGELEEYGAHGFRMFVKYICTLEHIKEAIEAGEIDIDYKLSHVLHRRFKQALKHFLWEKKDVIIHWFTLPRKKCQPLSEQVPDSAGKVNDFQLISDDTSFEKLFCIKFEGVENGFIVKIDESAVYNSMYLNEELYTMIGREMSLIFDVALGKGGPESVVESYYSVMKSQQHSGGQSNDTVSLRTKLDWSLPNVMQADKMVKEVAAIYIKGDSSKGLKMHRLPVIGDHKSVIAKSKVVQKLQAAQSRLPFLC
eukprot:gene13289-biopygen10600